MIVIPTGKFELASSSYHPLSPIGVVGYSVLPSCYTEAKLVCEQIFDETLHRYPELFRPMIVQPGHIAGSTKSGFWNPVEHIAFLVKSAQTLRAWPDFGGTLMWLSVDKCAQVIVELLKIRDETASDAYSAYHIENPAGQPWKEISPVLAAALDIRADRIITSSTWIKRVRRSPLLPKAEKPAVRLVDFLEYHFERMSCGRLILDTQKAKQHSDIMANEGRLVLG